MSSVRIPPDPQLVQHLRKFSILYQSLQIIQSSDTSGAYDDVWKCGMKSLALE